VDNRHFDPVSLMQGVSVRVKQPRLEAWPFLPRNITKTLQMTAVYLPGYAFRCLPAFR
jgi:hypothetical protein